MKNIILLLFSALTITISAQTPYADSLRTQLALQQTQNDSFQTVHQLCEFFNEIYVKTDSIKKYGNLAFNLSGSDQHKIGIGHLYLGSGNFSGDSATFFDHMHAAIDLLEAEEDLINTSIGYYLFSEWEIYRGDFKKSESYAQKGIDLLSPLWHGQNKRVASIYAWLYSNLASVAHQSGNLLKSAENAHEAQKFAILAEDKKREYGSLITLSSAYGDLSDPEKKFSTLEEREKYKPIAEQYMLEALHLVEKENFVRNLAGCHYNLSVFHSLHGQPAKSDSFLTLAIQHGTKHTNGLLLFNAYRMKGQNFSEGGQYDSAHQYLTLAKNYAIRLRSPHRVNRTDLSIATNESARGNYRQAESILEDLLPKLSGPNYLKTRSLAYENLSHVYAQRKKWKDAFTALEKFRMSRDSISSEENRDEINQLQARFESELQQYEIEQLKQEKDIQGLKIKQKNNLILLLILGGALIGIVVYFTQRHRVQKQKQTALETQQKLLRSQLNPHFLFNSLNSIQQFIYQKKDPQVIADYLGKFSRLTRRILQYSREDYVTLEDEIKFLKDYLDLQKIRFDEPFDYTIELEGDIDDSELMIPPLFTQPFVENSIEHGILNKQEKGQINVVFSKNDSQLIVTMRDNGIGREKAAFKKRNAEHRSLATKITMERLRMIERKLRKKASLVINDLTDKEMVTGTEVKVTLPLMYS